jgi:hypothetical protein
MRYDEEMTIDKRRKKRKEKTYLSGIRVGHRVLCESLRIAALGYMRLAFSFEVSPFGHCVLCGGI